VARTGTEQIELTIFFAFRGSLEDDHGNTFPQARGAQNRP
jgi:hypothetical protein